MQSVTPRGFSLLELLIVIVIIAILTSIAYPLYTHYLLKGRRSQAEVGLLHLAGRLESFYSLNSSYRDATLEALGVNAYTDDHSYQFVIQSAMDSSYVIAAVPLGQQAKEDTECGVLSLNETGERFSGGKTSTNQCWS